MTVRGYQDAAPLYWERGWRSILPVPAGEKKPPPPGYTGAEAPDASYADMAEWRSAHPSANTALRMPTNVIGVDVDDYDGKRGAAVIEHAQQLWGELPGTWASTSRAGTKSGIRFYRLAEPQALAGEVKFPDLGLAGVEIVQRHHRYALVFPSLHKEGRRYEWFDPDGQPCDPPSPDDLPFLPDAWVKALASRGPEHVDTDGIDAARSIRSWPGGPMSPRVRRRIDEASEALREGGQSRHDTALKAVMALERYGAEGEPGARDGLVALRQEFIGAAVADGSRTEGEAAREFERMYMNKRGHALIGATNGHDAGAAAPGRRQIGTDDDNGRLFAQAFSHCARYCPERGRWAVWNGTVWKFQPSGGGGARELMKQLARELPESSAEQTRHKRYSLSSRGVTAALEAASTAPGVATAIDEFDAHPRELNTTGGIVDLQTGALTASDPARLHTRSARAAPDPSADRTLWLGFLARTFGGDEELIGFVKRLAGYCATGLVREHVLPFLHGEGGNGKGVLVTTLVKILGDYGATSPSGFLMERSREEHPTEIARLIGKRLVICSEVKQGAQFHEARVKELTGGDMLTARYMGKDFTDFMPTHKLLLMGNDKPEVRAGGRSMWRRLKLIPFEHTVPEEEEILDLQGIFIRDHAPAILSWITEGAVEYLRSGLRPPAKVEFATKEYAGEEDTVSQWLEENAHVGGEPSMVKVKMNIAYSDYTGWCQSNGKHPLTSSTLGARLRKFGVVPVKSNGVRLYGGLSIRSKEDEGARW